MASQLEIEPDCTKFIQVSMNKIALSISGGVDDWAIIASNVQGFLNVLSSALRNSYNNSKGLFAVLLNVLAWWKILLFLLCC